MSEGILVNHEEALIVWDESRHIEHFVRTAVFDSSASSFGFLVPTPGRPTLAEAEDKALTIPHDWTRPKIKRVDDVELDPGLSLITYYFGDGPHPGVTSAAPDVLEETRVAGLDATVLAARDAEGLADWLQKRGFEQREALRHWLAIYVAKGWYITAFRYERPEGSDAGADIHRVTEDYMTNDLGWTDANKRMSITSKAVRISFPTTEPVYPYLEPADVPNVPHRILDLFVIADHRMDAVLVDNNSKAWSATTAFAANVRLLDDGDRFASTLPGLELPSHFWVTQYIDAATKRETSDIVFRPSTSDEELRPAPIVWHQSVPAPVPYELIPLGLAGAWYWRRRRQSQRRRETEKSIPLAAP
jgi:hypothetical protein